MQLVFLVVPWIDEKTKLVAVTHMSNVLGTIVDVKTISGIIDHCGSNVNNKSYK